MVQKATNHRPAVDAYGQAVIDPSPNVLDLVSAAIQRQDDLREADGRFLVSELRRVDDLAGLRAAHAMELGRAESERLDAIRAVDQSALANANQISIQQANTLSKSVTDSAEALRVQVEATRQATENRLAAALAPIQTTLAEVQRVQYEQQGQKTAGDDPVVKALAEMQKFMIETQTSKATVTDSSGSRLARLAVTIAGFSAFGSVMFLIIAVATHGKF